MLIPRALPVSKGTWPEKQFKVGRGVTTCVRYCGLKLPRSRALPTDKAQSYWGTGFIGGSAGAVATPRRAHEAPATLDP